MGEETLRKVLKDFGLTETEADVYLFLAKHEALTGTEIARQIKKDKAQVFRTLKNLQTKGLAESTIEVPARFTPVSFERVVESTIKAKKDEAAHIESAKEELLDYWKNISKSKLDLTLEKFMVIEGRHKVYSKIAQMIKETKTQFSTITTVNALVRADQFGLYDAAFKNPLKSKIQFRFLTELTSQNLKTLKATLKKTSKKGVNFRGRNPDLGLSLFPHMAIRDNEETVFFLAPRTSNSTEENDEMCLWTNCKDLVQAFRFVFEDSWRKATDIRAKIAEAETGIPSPQTCFIENPEHAKKKYDDAMQSAKHEIFLVTSSEYLTDFHKEISQLKEKTKTLNIKVLAPITNENLQASLKLSECCDVRHAPHSYLTTIIIDEKHFFQFGTPLHKPSTEKSNPFENIIYSNNKEYIERTRNLLNDVWKNAQTPSAITLDPATWINTPQASPSLDNPLIKTIRQMHATRTTNIDEKFAEKVTESDVINKIVKAQKASVGEGSKEIVITYSTNGQAIVNPPVYLNLPNMLFHVYHMEKHSTYGSEDTIMIQLWLNTPAGYAYVPAAVVTDNPASVDFWEKICGATPAAQNVQLFKKDEIQVYIHGNVFFAGWTAPIRLLQHNLPPSCLLIEGYGKTKTVAYDMVVPSGYKLRNEGNILDAFVTFLHPSTKYSGPGTDGCFARDVIIEFHPP